MDSTAWCRVGCAAGMVLGLAGIAVADVFNMPPDLTSMEFVTVGGPGNTQDMRYGRGYTGNPWEPLGYGGIGHTYNIGKCEATNAQYAEFLNAVAGADQLGLYNPSMGSGYGGITRSGAAGSYTYGTIPGRANKPVNYVSWYDALRFANWLHNNQPTGATGPSTTEDGAYDMSLGSSVVRKPGAKMFLASEDEWYKAAYYKGGGTNAGYWDYQTQSDTAPTPQPPPGTNTRNGSANYGGVNELTDVGAYTFKPSDGAYGTFDQGGNLNEWLDGVYAPMADRPVRGGSFYEYPMNFLHARMRGVVSPVGEGFFIGFRVAEVPEPASVILLVMGGVGMHSRRWRSWRWPARG